MFDFVDKVTNKNDILFYLHGEISTLGTFDTRPLSSFIEGTSQMIKCAILRRCHFYTYHCNCKTVNLVELGP